MKTFLAFVVFVIFGLFILGTASANEPVKEMTMPTEVGFIVLTVEPCPLKNQLGYDYYGYATDPGNPEHPGCWNADDDKVQIWFLNENVVGIYKKTLFKPRVGI